MKTHLSWRTGIITEEKDSKSLVFYNEQVNSAHFSIKERAKL